MGKRVTITLTGRSPVTVDEDQWPVIARSTWDECDSEYAPEANKEAIAGFEVRRNSADGRMIAYGTYSFDARFSPGVRPVHAAAGYLLDAAGNPAEAISRVKRDLSSYELPEAWQPEWELLAGECVMDLPAEDL